LVQVLGRANDAEAVKLLGQAKAENAVAGDAAYALEAVQAAYSVLRKSRPRPATARAA
jgi:hypothetical protein